MKIEKLPHGITHIQRTRWLPRIVAILLAGGAFMLISHLHLFADLFHSVRKSIPSEERTVTTIKMILLGIYIVPAMTMQESMRTWIYSHYGKLSKEDFINILEGKYESKWPAPKVMPVWVTIIAKLCPVFFASVIPGLIFFVLGWNWMQFAAIMVSFLYLGDVVSSLYYLLFWNQNMVEYIKPGEVFGIKYFDIYFFPKDQTDLSKLFIEQFRLNIKDNSLH